MRPNGSLASRIDFWGGLIPGSTALNHVIFHINPTPTILSFVLLYLSQGLFPGPGSRRPNVSVLKNEDFVNVVANAWASWKLRKRSLSSLKEWWDVRKQKIQHLAMVHCSFKN